LFGGDRDKIRQVFVDAWRKRIGGEPMQPLELVVAGIIELHPEYQPMLLDGEQAKARDFLPEGGESNPFLHMGMHITLQEQVSTDRPAGIAGYHQRLCQRLDDPHEAEHQMMECLGRILWEAQSNKRMPDEAAYLECLKRLVL
jgi:hypothetical protein